MMKFIALSLSDAVGSIRVNTDEIYTPMFHKPLSLFGRGSFYTCVMSLLYPVTREQTILFENQTLKQKIQLYIRLSLSSPPQINIHSFFDNLSQQISQIKP